MALSSFPYFETVLGIMVVKYIFETYLAWRQHIALNLATQPKAPFEISQEEFHRSRAYNLRKSRFNFIRGFAIKLKDIGCLYFGILPWFWKKSEEFLLGADLDATDERWLSLVFLAGLLICSQIFELPFSLYSTFAIGDYHGSKEQTISFFLCDKIAFTIVVAVISPPIIFAMIVLVKKGGPYLVAYIWAFTLVWSLGEIIIYPVLIAPIFNNFARLAKGGLRDEIEKLASKLSFPLDEVFVVDGSSGSNHNVYTYGFFSCNWLVLYDSLIQQCKNDEEVLAAIAHELGHWKHIHSMYAFFIGKQIMNFLEFGGFDIVRKSKDMFQSFGFETQPIVIGLILFQYSVEPLIQIMRLLLKIISRDIEFKADAFVEKLGYGINLQAILIRKQNEDPTTMNTDPWYSAYHYSLLLPIERLTAIDQLDRKTD